MLRILMDGHDCARLLCKSNFRASPVETEEGI